MGVRAESIPRYYGAQEGLPEYATKCAWCSNWKTEHAEYGWGFCPIHDEWYYGDDGEECLDWKEA